jgi:hypothetical protein
VEVQAAHGRRDGIDDRAEVRVALMGDRDGRREQQRRRDGQGDGATQGAPPLS